MSRYFDVPLFRRTAVLTLVEIKVCRNNGVTAISTILLSVEITDRIVISTTRYFDKFYNSKIKIKISFR